MLHVGCCGENGGLIAESLHQSLGCPGSFGHLLLVNLTTLLLTHCGERRGRERERRGRGGGEEGERRGEEGERRGRGGG